MTYRFVGHSRSDPGLYRRPGELDAWRQRDPLLRARRALAGEHGLPEAALAALEADAGADVATSFSAAFAAPYPDPGAAYRA
jgi:TPP-dependent pyruvate/acetoin dehydrogenase alpha subunit